MSATFEPLWFETVGGGLSYSGLSPSAKLPDPFSRRIATPFDADATGQATLYRCFDEIGCEEGKREDAAVS